MNKTIGIVTLYDIRPNYGNRLQNLAMQTVLEKMGDKAITYSFEQSIFGVKGLVKYIIWKIFGIDLSGIHYQSGELIRTIRFYIFNKKYIKSKRINSIDDIDEMDFYIVGSDQTWNSNWYKDNDFKKAMYLLTFSPPSKRVCFSPSFGVDHVPTEMKMWFKKYLLEFNYLSVREESGARIIKELTGRNAEVLIDPTLLLTKNDWRNFSKRPMGAKKGSILTYFLSPKCEAAKDLLAIIEDGREVCEVLNSDKSISHTYDPCEFLWLIDHADIILTDSFHACVFSFVFNKPFVVYDRNWNGGNMNSRLETFLKEFQLERKYINSGKKNDIWEHNYEEGYKQWERNRHKAMEYLKTSLGE